MARSRIAATLATLLVVVAGCGDDDEGASDATATSAVTSVEADAGDDGTDPDVDGTTTSSTVPDAEAEEPPGGPGGEEEGASDDFVHVADLTGDTEVPGPGDPTGSGRIELRAGAAGEVCIDMVVTGLASDVTASHIHRGAAGTSGDVVIPIGEPTEVAGDVDTWDDVCVPVDPEVARQLAVDASQFYANVHTADHPDGAVRGQLEYATIFDLELS